MVEEEQHPSEETMKCLIVDLANTGLVSSGPDVVSHLNGVQAEFCTGEKAISKIESQQYHSLVIFSEKENVTLFRILNDFRSKYGAMGRYQAIFTQEPHPQFLADIFEYGIEQLFSIKNWQIELIYYLKGNISNFTNQYTTEPKLIQMQKVLNSGEQGAIEQARNEIAEFSEYDFLAAFSYARMLEASGDFQQAVELYEKSVDMNHYFIPALSNLAECLMVVGRVDESLLIYSKLESRNPRNANRKYSLSTAFLEIGDQKRADVVFEEAKKIDEHSPKKYEAEVIRHLKKSEVEEAVRKLDHIESAGPFVVAKVNELGVGLSKDGQGELALSLYEKAHRIVRPELKYKITINAALASFRTGHHKMALQFCKRCEEEYGGPFPKLEKIRTRVNLAIDEEGAA